MLIQFKTKEEFKEVRKKFQKEKFWKMYMWNFFKSEIWCYYVEEDCFISLKRANELGIK